MKLAPWQCYKTIPSRYVCPIVHQLLVEFELIWQMGLDVIGHEATDCFLYKLYL